MSFGIIWVGDKRLPVTCHRLLRTVERVQDVPEIDPDLGQARLNRERLLIVGNGLFKPACRVKNRPEFFCASTSFGLTARARS